MRQWLIWIVGFMLFVGLACSSSAPAAKPTIGLATPTPRVQVTPANGEALRIISGALDTTQEISGTLPAGARSTVLLVQITGVSPGSPSRASRRLAMRLKCNESQEEAMLTWYYRPTDYDTNDGQSSRYACNELTTVYFSYDYNYRWLVLESPTSLTEALSFSLEAEVHSPY